MKKPRFLSLVLALLLLAACADNGANGLPDGAGQPDALSDALALPADVTPPENEDIIICDPPSTQLCRIVDGAEDGDLLLAALPGGFYDGGVFRLTVTEGTEIWMDGEQITAGQLEDGMPIEVAFHGEVQESFPAQFDDVLYLNACSRGSQENPGGSLYDLCGFYLQVLDDLWQVDPNLNNDISTAIVDLSQAPGIDTLNNAEKSALLWRFGELHGVDVLDSSEPSVMELLEGAGYYSDCGSEIRGLDDACLFTIRPHETETEEIYSLPVLRFDADKWRGPRAAYCFYDCTAVWAEFGTWGGYQVGSEMIS